MLFRSQRHATAAQSIGGFWTGSKLSSFVIKLSYHNRLDDSHADLRADLAGAGLRRYTQEPFLDGGKLVMQSVQNTHQINLANIHFVDVQKAEIVRNTRQFLQGLPANNVLLREIRE